MIKIDTTKGMSFSGRWNLLISQTAEQFEQEKTGILPKTKIRLMDYIKD
jgi:hypothetical protein